MQIGNASVAFHATGIGANGMQKYTFALDLFKPIDEEVLISYLNLWLIFPWNKHWIDASNEDVLRIDFFYYNGIFRKRDLQLLILYYNNEFMLSLYVKARVLVLL